jgi:thiosulfate reductase cytochrome b subunit
MIALEKAVRLHNVCGIILTVSYLGFFIGNLVSPNRKHYRIRFNGLLKRMNHQIYYFTIGIFKGEKNPFKVENGNKFNPVQKVSYLFIMYLCLPLIILTGWDMMFPGSISIPVIGVKGLIVSDLIHIISGFIVSIFLIIHVYLCTLGPAPGSLFMSILSGYHPGDD